MGGATGFLGAELVSQLRAAGHEIVAVSHSGGRIVDVNVKQVDATDEGAVAESAKGCEGAFFAVGKVSRDAGDAELLYRANVVTTERGLAGLRRAGVRRVVYASTSGTIACGTDPCRAYTESDPTPHAIVTRWPYYRAKLFAEHAALAMNERGVFEVVVVNPSLLLGPGDRRSSSTTDVRRFLARSLPAMPRGGIAFVDVRDAAAGMRSAYDKGKAGERYLLSASNMPLSTFFGRLSRLSGTPAPALRLPKNRDLALASHWLYGKALSVLGSSTPIEAESVEMSSHYWYCDASKAERELGFAPRDAQETLRDTLADIDAERTAGG